MIVRFLLVLLLPGVCGILKAPKTHVTGYEGKTLELPCSAKAVEPMPSPSNTYRWQLPTSRIDTNTSSNGSLIIPDLHPSDFGEYVCFISLSNIEFASGLTVLTVARLDPNPIPDPFTLLSSIKKSLYKHRIMILTILSIISFTFLVFWLIGWLEEDDDKPKVKIELPYLNKNKIVADVERKLRQYKRRRMRRDEAALLGSGTVENEYSAFSIEKHSDVRLSGHGSVQNVSPAVNSYGDIRTQSVQSVKKSGPNLTSSQGSIPAHTSDHLLQDSTLRMDAEQSYSTESVWSETEQE